MRLTTGIPYLTIGEQPLLLGPGSIFLAHTKDEFDLKEDLEEAIGLYSLLLRKLLANDAQD